jgi:PleD family two-component response regulator
MAERACILIVEDERDTADMLSAYFESQGYQVLQAAWGKDAVQLTAETVPNLILLDIRLPDIDGYEVCRNLRTSTRTSHIPVIFLTQKDERSDRLQGLELGADDYITKPFDIEELKLRVQGAIRRSERESLTDPRSGLPAGRLIEEQLRKIIRETGWAYLDVRINHFEAFKDVYGFVAGDDVIRFASMLIGEVLDGLGTSGDFLGHAGGDNFVIVTTESAAPPIRQKLKERFAEEVQSHYNFMDRQQGFILAPNAEGQTEQFPLMTMAVGLVAPSQHSFADIREITELAAEARRQDAGGSAAKG